MDFDLIII